MIYKYTLKTTEGPNGHALRPKSNPLDPTPLTTLGNIAGETYIHTDLPLDPATQPNKLVLEQITLSDAETLDLKSQKALRIRKQQARSIIRTKKSLEDDLTDTKQLLHDLLKTVANIQSTLSPAQKHSLKQHTTNAKIAKILQEEEEFSSIANTIYRSKLK